MPDRFQPSEQLLQQRPIFLPPYPDTRSPRWRSSFPDVGPLPRDVHSFEDQQQHWQPPQRILTPEERCGYERHEHSMGTSYEPPVTLPLPSPPALAHNMPYYIPRNPPAAIIPLPYGQRAEMRSDLDTPHYRQQYQYQNHQQPGTQNLQAPMPVYNPTPGRWSADRRSSPDRERSSRHVYTPQRQPSRERERLPSLRNNPRQNQGYSQARHARTTSNSRRHNPYPMADSHRGRVSSSSRYPAPKRRSFNPTQQSGRSYSHRCSGR